MSSLDNILRTMNEYIADIFNMYGGQSQEYTTALRQVRENISDEVLQQAWIFIGRTDPETETPILWPPHAKSLLIGKDPDAGKDLGQEEKGMTEDKIAGWHEFGWTLGVGDGQGGLACCNPWGHKE